MKVFWQSKVDIKERIYIPKYYDPNIKKDLFNKNDTHELVTIKDLIDKNVLKVNTGDEIGKMAYGTGNIPFVRTSDISNWEIKSAPKQGVSKEIFNSYSHKQDVRVGDIFLVRDGTYLIGSNCIVTELDDQVLYQSHILKFRVLDQKQLNPHIFFLLLNSKLVQNQIRSIQFTADTIDTIGNRFLEITLPIPKQDLHTIIINCEKALQDREIGKAFIKKAPPLIEDLIRKSDLSVIEEFLSSNIKDLKKDIIQETVSDEFSEFTASWISQEKILKQTYIPKYYDPSIEREINALESSNDIFTIGELVEKNLIEIRTGDEIGKISYGTGNIPFIRTSDFSNWEIKHNPKQGISEEIYLQYASKQDIKVNDIFLVRDGTYLVGSSCLVTEEDKKSLYCAGLFKIRCLSEEYFDGFFLLGILNSHIVKKQFRSKQFTRDVIDTLGNRIMEVKIPIPKAVQIREGISKNIKKIIENRIYCRTLISTLSKEI